MWYSRIIIVISWTRNLCRLYRLDYKFAQEIQPVAQATRRSGDPILYRYYISVNYMLYTKQNKNTSKSKAIRRVFDII